MVTTWNLWDQQMLSSAGLPNTGHNRLFMDQWHAHASSSCDHNPVDVSRPYGGSGNCKLLPGTTRHAQNYQTPSDTQAAFARQIAASTFSTLRSALKSGNPFVVADASAVRDDLKTWGSPAFADFYLNEVNAAQTPTTINAPQALKGWKDLQRTVNHHMPDAMSESARNRARALRQLSHARKVLR